MSTPATSLPVIDRDDAPIAVLNRWVTTVPEQQRSLADASLGAWGNTSWPAGLRSVNCFVSTNGDTVFTYEQWSGDQDLAAFSAAGRAENDRAVTAEHDKTEHSDPFVCRLHRSSIMDTTSTPGCVVVTTFAFEEAETARAWADAICHADATQPEPTPGLISRHFLISPDGTQVLNYSEWLDEDAHRGFLENPVQTPEWQRVDEFTGLTHGPGRRCRPHGALTATHSGPA